MDAKDVRICPAPEVIVGYDKLKDRFEVSRTGFLDLGKAFANNAVPADISGDDANYNGVEDPNKVIGKPKDSFELMHYNKSVHDYKPSSPNPGGEAE